MTARRLILPLCAMPLVAASAPALSLVEGGLWEVTREGAPPVRLCLASPPAGLGQFEHRGARCTRDSLNKDGDSLVTTYSCGSAGFGRSDITAVTPRSLRVHTQGISGNGPFNYRFQARRVGNCGIH